MPIAGFNPEEFAKNLAQQAIEVVPADIVEESKKYVVNKVYQFCVLAGNALNQDPNIKITADQACIITQYIGEWTFHKSIDLIRAHVPQELWDPVLQQVAFAVFEIAKQTQVAGLEQAQCTEMIEKEVVACYEKTLRDLAQQGRLNNEEISEILSYSNIDEMAKQNQEKLSPEDEERTLKYASIALLLKTFSKEKVEKILSQLPPEESEHISKFLQIEDLDKKLDPNIASEFLNSLKSKICSSSDSKPKAANYLKKLSAVYLNEDIVNVVKYERSKIKDYVMFSINENIPQAKQIDFSQHISRLIYSYIKHKLSA